MPDRSLEGNGPASAHPVCSPPEAPMTAPRGYGKHCGRGRFGTSPASPPEIDPGPPNHTPTGPFAAHRARDRPQNTCSTVACASPVPRCGWRCWRRPGRRCDSDDRRTHRSTPPGPGTPAKGQQAVGGPSRERRNRKDVSPDQRCSVSIRLDRPGGGNPASLVSVSLPRVGVWRRLLMYSVSDIVF